jgi:hypothetical protein
LPNYSIFPLVGKYDNNRQMQEPSDNTQNHNHLIPQSPLFKS